MRASAGSTPAATSWSAYRTIADQVAGSRRHRSALRLLSLRCRSVRGVGAGCRCTGRMHRSVPSASDRNALPLAELRLQLVRVTVEVVEPLLQGTERRVDAFWRAVRVLEVDDADAFGDEGQAPPTRQR